MVNNTVDLWAFRPKEQRRSSCLKVGQRLSGGLLLTSAGTSRLLPRCWLKERHQASVYPFMLGTYFFTVSSLSLSHTPSSLWIYGGENKSNGAGHSQAVLLLWKREGHTHTHTLRSEVAGESQGKLDNSKLKLQQGAFGTDTESRCAALRYK